MKKYEFIKNGVDDYTLKYKDNEINFNSNVDIANRLQNTIANGKTRMIMELAKQGISLKDLTIETKKDGKTYYDNTNRTELENTYIQQEQGKVFMDIIKELLGKSVEELFMEMELETEEESQEFAKEFAEILGGRFQNTTKENTNK